MTTDARPALPEPAQHADLARLHTPADPTARPSLPRLADLRALYGVDDHVPPLAGIEALGGLIDTWDEQQLWTDYLAASPTYGTFNDRRPEYRWVFQYLTAHGLDEGDLVVDVGAGPCDLDRYLREAGWSGRYLPIDGTTGVDLDDWYPDVTADWYVCIETIEHVTGPVADRWARAFPLLARRGVVITTPNADVCDVLAADHTHQIGLTPEWFTERRYGVDLATFNARGDGDTIRATVAGYDPAWA